MAMSISPENERLLSEAVSSGRFRSEDEALGEALRLLSEQQGNGSPERGDVLPPDEWLREFDRITKSRTGGNPRMDDSRESIYGDRGA